ncbi:MAG: MlaD family protein, partial [Burkholderiaceae bacterium]
GSYIGVDIGRTGQPRREFAGLKQPPAFMADVPGRRFALHTDNLGSIDVGSPVFFRRLQAGQVTRYELDKDGKGVTIEVFIHSPYERFVTGNTRFWQASGLDVKLDSTGIRVDTQSIVSILIGGLAFETPLETAELPPAAANTRFNLFPTRNAAFKNPETEVIKWEFVFNESVRGLAVGAPLDFRGIEFGSVTAIGVDWSETGRPLNIVVEAEVYPARLRAQEEEPVAATEEQRRAFVESLITSGLRAQLRTGNLLTGQLYVAMDFFPSAPKIKWDARKAGLKMPTMPSSQNELQASIASIAAKLNAFPLEQIGADLRQTLHAATKMSETANKMMQRVDTEITPEAREAIVEARQAIASAQRVFKPDSPLAQDAHDAMREIQRAAAAFRSLADYLDRHPEALLRGKRQGGVDAIKDKK